MFNTFTVGAAVTPAVIQTFFSHYLNRNSRAKKPTAHISYDEGINLIRQFLIFASHHTVEEVQRFTAQWVPHPSWVRVDEITINENFITTAAEAIQVQLGSDGIDKIGGKTWWQWRRPGSELKAEWIEMRADYHERKKTGEAGHRVMLYVHGGAYFFGSVDEHRYQMQRHARKVKARIFAPRYRLAPQFPFPAGLHDCLAAYLYLLSVQDPSTIVLAGDSAGGGMIVSMLVTLRDRGLPLPAGAILISPWVDLTHSFPSVSGENPLDYIPPYGFHQRPSESWPPPNSDDLAELKTAPASRSSVHANHSPEASEKDAVQGFHVTNTPAPNMENANASTGTTHSQIPRANTVPGSGSRSLSIIIDGELIEIKDQIQMYTTNELLSHPLVSPILQPSLGGLPPLLILVGGAEMLRDEQIYLAHKAAHPEKYMPGGVFLDEHGMSQVNRWKPTDVQIQVWDDLCHVAPTLSFTRPAKYMYRSVAQFGAWALARAQKTSIEILDDDDVSIISSSSEESRSEPSKFRDPSGTVEVQQGQIGKAGDPLPPFVHHMIRQRVNRHGVVSALEPASELPSCNMQREDIGVIKEGPVKKWMTAKKRWDTKYAAEKRRVQKQRMREIEKGYQSFGDNEVPPPSALAGRIKAGNVEREKKKVKSSGMTLWALWGSKHDRDTMEREQQADKQPETVTATGNDGAGARPLHDIEKLERNPRDNYSRSRSRRRTVTDENQTGGNVDEETSVAELLALRKANDEESKATQSNNLGSEAHLSPNYATSSQVPIADRLETDLRRPKLDGIAFPFSLLQKDKNSSMTTLTSTVGIEPAKDVRTEGVRRSGLSSSGSGRSGGSEEGFSSLDVGKGKEVAKEQAREERPGLETFVTAMEVPKVVIGDEVA